MGKANRTKTEIQVMIDRLQWLAGKRILMRGLILKEDSAYVLKAIGAKKFVKKDVDGKEKISCEYNENGERLLHEIFIKEYTNVAQKLTVFYKAVEKLPTEKMKEICELLYVDGYSLNYVAIKERVTVQTMYSYRDEIVSHLKSNGAGFVVTGEGYKV